MELVQKEGNNNAKQGEKEMQEDCEKKEKLYTTWKQEDIQACSRQICRCPVYFMQLAISISFAERIDENRAATFKIFPGKGCLGVCMSNFSHMDRASPRTREPVIQIDR